MVAIQVSLSISFVSVSHLTSSGSHSAVAALGESSREGQIREIPWETAEEYIAEGFDNFRETCFEALRSHHGTGQRSEEEMEGVLRDIDMFFCTVKISAEDGVALMRGIGGES